MAQAMGIPVPWVSNRRVAIAPGWLRRAAYCRAAVGVNHPMGLDWVLKAFIVVVVGGMGQSRRLDRGGDLQSACWAYASIFW